MLQGVRKLQRFSRLLVVLVGVLGFTLAYRGATTPVQAQTGTFPASLNLNFTAAAVAGPLATTGFQLSGPLVMNFAPGSGGNFTATLTNSFDGVQVPATGMVNGQMMAITFNLGGMNVVFGSGALMAPLNSMTPSSLTIGASTFGLPGQVLGGGMWADMLGSIGNWSVTVG